MTIDDLRLGLRLTRQAGWNQTESDWLRFIDMEPEGCFVAELNGSSVGTTTTCIFDKVAWIAMVLVGTALLAYFTWDKHWVFRYSIMPILTGAITFGFAVMGIWSRSM